MRLSFKERLEVFDIEKELSKKVGGDLHHMRLKSLANATLGVMKSSSLAVSIIGQALAQAKSLDPKHAVKQVDRLLSNAGIQPWEIFPDWVSRTVGDEKSIVVAMDWTDFDKDDQSTLCLNLVGKHGKSVPLIWLSMWKHELKDRRNDIEDTCLRRLSECLAQDVKVIILADRGFGDAKLFAYLEQLGFGYVIRFRDNIHVTSVRGEMRPALEWVTAGQARKLADAKVTARKQPVPAIVFARDKRMKEAWCLATSEKDAGARIIVDLYAQRW